MTGRILHRGRYSNMTSGSRHDPQENGTVVENGTVDYPVTVQVGEKLNIISVKHKNETIPYFFSNETVSFSTGGSSVFTLNYTRGGINGAEDD